MLNKFYFWSKKRSDSPEMTHPANSTNSAEKLRQKKELDKKLVFSLNSKKFPSFKQLRYFYQVFDGKQKNVIAALIGLMIISLFVIAGNFYIRNFLPIPTQGGEYTEALVGAPQYINPLLSQTNDVDSDLARLLFSGLLKYDKNLQLVPDLATEWSHNSEETEYTFTLRKDALWHDGEPVTIDDVIFTFESMKDPDFKSPLLVSMRGVTVQQIDEQTVKFILPQQYPSFLELMTTGILPEHIWGLIPPINANLAEYNLKPIGNGPWKFESRSIDKTLGNIRSMTLVRNENFYGSKPYINSLTFKFYPDFQTAIAALKNQSVEGISFLPKELKADVSGRKNFNFFSFDLPQYTAVFFNDNKNENLKNKAVRKALGLSIDKNQILSEALQLEGEIIDGPILPVDIDASKNKMEYNPSLAMQLLEEADFKSLSKEEYIEKLRSQLTAKKEESDEDEDSTENSDDNEQPITISETPENQDSALLSTIEFIENSEQKIYRFNKDDEILEVTLTTVSQPENTAAAQLLQKFWQEIGIRTNLSIVEGTKISRDIIKPREFEILLFGIIVGSNPDPAPFWHSSQAQDPGLNLSQFSNRQADKIIEDAATFDDHDKLVAEYQKLEDILNEEIPAIFLYKPTYTYMVDQKVKGVNLTKIIIPSDRFIDSEQWYIDTKRKFQGTYR